MRLANGKAAGQAQCAYARLAGHSAARDSHPGHRPWHRSFPVAGDGTFAPWRCIAASERLYRAALASLVVITFSSIVLVLALCATLEAWNAPLAQLGLISSLADSFLALVVRMCGFARLHVYLSITTSWPVAAKPTSAIWIFPEHYALSQSICFPPRAVAVLATVPYLMFFAGGR